MAWATFYDAVTSGKVRHTDQPQVNAALPQAALRDIGGGKALSKKSSEGDITPLAAMTFALWGAPRDDVKRPTRGRVGATGGGRRVVTF